MNNKVDVYFYIPQKELVTHVEFSHQVVWPPHPCQLQPAEEHFAVWEGDVHQNIVARKHVDICYTCVVSHCLDGQYWSHFSLSSTPFYTLKVGVRAENTLFSHYIVMYDGTYKNRLNLSTHTALSSSHIMLLAINTWKASSENCRIFYSAIERVVDVSITGAYLFTLKMLHEDNRYTMYEISKDEMMDIYKGHGGNLNYRSRVRVTFHSWSGYEDPWCVYGGMAISRVQSGFKNIVRRPYRKFLIMGEFQLLCGNRLPTILSVDDIIPIFSLVRLYI